MEMYQKISFQKTVPNYKTLSNINKEILVCPKYHTKTHLIQIMDLQVLLLKKKNKLLLLCNRKLELMMLR